MVFTLSHFLSPIRLSPKTLFLLFRSKNKKCMHTQGSDVLMHYVHIQDNSHGL